jgi:hypothetical protein
LSDTRSGTARQNGQQGQKTGRRNYPHIPLPPSAYHPFSLHK